MSRRKKDLTGKRFGRLTVIRDIGRRTKHGEVYWECVCDCGKNTEVLRGNLGGNTSSCGCLRSESISERLKDDLTGQRFGRLVVIKESRKSQKRTKRLTYLDCVCDCGKHTEVLRHHLKSGQTSSCGCLQKQLATEIIKKMLEHNKENAFVEKTSLNQLISKVPSNNKSGVKGVCWDKGKGKWKTYIGINKKKINLGFFAKKEDAIAARKEAEEKYHKPILEKYGKVKTN